MELIELPVPTATAGAVVIKVLGAMIAPFVRGIHDGSIAVYNLHLPLVPNPSNIGRVHSVGPDAVRLKEGDLIYFDPLIRGRDDSSVFIIQGHHGGQGPAGKKLMQGEWRDGSLQKYQKVPLECCHLLDENRLLKQLGYHPAELQEITIQAMCVAALIEGADLKAGDTVIIGPTTGTFGGTACEIALLLGAQVVALGRDTKKLESLAQHLGNTDRFKYVVMTGDVQKDTAAIKGATLRGEGAEVFNDWAPGILQDSPYWTAAFLALKPRGRVVLSGAPSGNVSIPYALAMHHCLSINGQAMCSPQTIDQTIRLVEAGTLKLGRKSGAEIAIYPLDRYHEAEENAVQNGGFRNYTYVTPNVE
ncbi:hypothetical protein LTR84_005796 [Exophiala bonariae]|uniref:Alcohol dehydrogenase-like C-terminal domain-containing protein n=1 Tax=Exophiala bonariae TaxID=1690606 RepID=A0AAV9N3P3_9EURO|nr:hypothetical protein LTR84_005796 [Exophiala bonariae]